VVQLTAIQNSRYTHTHTRGLSKGTHTCSFSSLCPGRPHQQSTARGSPPGHCQPAQGACTQAGRQVGRQCRGAGGAKPCIYVQCTCGIVGDGSVGDVSQHSRPPMQPCIPVLIGCNAYMPRAYAVICKTYACMQSKYLLLSSCCHSNYSR
jgi:hypothetical protein